jgi:hypothetical protein
MTFCHEDRGRCFDRHAKARGQRIQVRSVQGRAQRGAAKGKEKGEGGHGSSENQLSWSFPGRGLIPYQLSRAVVALSKAARQSVRNSARMKSAVLLLFSAPARFNSFSMRIRKSMVILSSARHRERNSRHSITSNPSTNAASAMSTTATNKHIRDVRCAWQSHHGFAAVLVDVLVLVVISNLPMGTAVDRHVLVSVDVSVPGHSSARSSAPLAHLGVTAHAKNTPTSTASQNRSRGS